MQRWMKYFPREQILVVSLHDMDTGAGLHREMGRFSDTIAHLFELANPVDVLPRTHLGLPMLLISV